MHFFRFSSVRPLEVSSLLGWLSLLGACAPTAPYPSSAATAPSVASSEQVPVGGAAETARVAPSSNSMPATSTPSPAPDEKSTTVSAPRPAEPPAPLFPGRDTVTYGEFVDELRRIADDLTTDPEVLAAHQRLLAEKSLTAEELPLESFSRVRLVFESARDSGLWGIRGTITDQMPWSDRVWQQWGARAFDSEAPQPGQDGRTFPTAVGECDELGALFATVARDLGVAGFVGLHWPTWNHVVPIWQVTRQDGTFVRIIVPATQTFLDSRDTIGTTGLPTNRVVFPYVRKDRKPDTLLAADLARYLLAQSRAYGGLSTEELTSRRLWHRWNNRPEATP